MSIEPTGRVVSSIFERNSLASDGLRCFGIILGPIVKSKRYGYDYLFIESDTEASECFRN